MARDGGVDDFELKRSERILSKDSFEREIDVYFLLALVRRWWHDQSRWQSRILEVASEDVDSD